MKLEGIDHVALAVPDLDQTVEWYRDNESWWAPSKDATESFYASKGQ